MSLLNRLNKLKPFKKLNKQEFSWVLYDVGNSAYTMLSCSLIPIWFKNLACLYTKSQETEMITEQTFKLLNPEQVSAVTSAMTSLKLTNADGITTRALKLLDAPTRESVKAALKAADSLVTTNINQVANAQGLLGQTQATSKYSLVIAVVTLIIAFIGPICGALADHKNTRKIFFTTTVAAGVVGCILNSFATSWVLFLVLYVLSKVFYQASLTFYDSMLNDITTDERMDEVSSYGYAWGYIGSCIPFLLALLAYLLSPDMLNVISEPLAKILGFSITGIWWLVVSIPLFKNYKQIHFVEQKNAVKNVFVQLGSTLKKIVTTDKKVFLFLIAFFLYIDGVDTIINQCINIGTELGLNTVGQVIFLLLTQVVAFGGSLVFARLSKKYDTVKLILACIVGYFCVCLYSLTLEELWQFAVMAFGVGCFQGSIQSLSRSYFSRIVPASNSGEYFGLYDIFSKGASFLGSLVISTVLSFPGGNINLAVGSLAVFFALGFIFLLFADKQPLSEEAKND